MSRVLLPFSPQAALTRELAHRLDARVGRLDWHRFPDGESLITIEDRLEDASVAIVASLYHPDELALALQFAAATARELGARSLGLIAPYMAYMRQDRRFHPGEAVSASLFAEFLENSFDWIVTVDPHLHRNNRLDVLFRKPARRVAAAPLVADWIRGNVDDPVLIGPDAESTQWVADIAERAGAPFQLLSKTRHGDREVEVTLPDPVGARDRTPVVIDDIVSSGRTMIETLGHLNTLGLAPADCIAIHAVFADDAYQQVLNAGAVRVVSTDSIPHESNGISLAAPLAAATADLLV